MKWPNFVQILIFNVDSFQTVYKGKLLTTAYNISDENKTLKLWCPYFFIYFPFWLQHLNKEFMKIKGET